VISAATTAKSRCPVYARNFSRPAGAWENLISARGKTQAEAWLRAVEQAEAIGMASKQNPQVGI
jgi:hypothetical protein